MSEAQQAKRRTDRRVVRTQRAIINAFEKLLGDRNAEKITVSAIAREANIDRKTFYLHYNSVRDLADQQLAAYVERVINALKKEGAGKTVLEQLDIILAEVNSIIMSNRTAYANIATRMSIDQILERFATVVVPSLLDMGLNSRLTSDAYMRMRLQFYLAGAISLYSTWLKSSQGEPIEIVSTIISQSFATLYQQQP